MTASSDRKRIRLHLATDYQIPICLMIRGRSMSCRFGVTCSEFFGSSSFPSREKFSFSKPNWYWSNVNVDDDDP